MTKFLKGGNMSKGKFQHYRMGERSRNFYESVKYPEDYQEKLDEDANSAHEYIMNKLLCSHKTSPTKDLEQDLQLYLKLNPGIGGFGEVKGKYASRAVAKFLRRRRL